MAFAEPAASAPPTSVARMSQGDGTSRPARNIAGTVVTSSRKMISGLVSR